MDTARCKNIFYVLTEPLALAIFLCFFAGTLSVECIAALLKCGNRMNPATSNIHQQKRFDHNYILIGA
jgi:hypothetical protein